MIKDCGFTSVKKIISFHKNKSIINLVNHHIHSQDYESDLSNTLLNREDYLYCSFRPFAASIINVKKRRSQYWLAAAVIIERERNPCCNSLYSFSLFSCTFFAKRCLSSSLNDAYQSARNCLLKICGINMPLIQYQFLRFNSAAHAIMILFSYNKTSS